MDEGIVTLYEGDLVSYTGVAMPPAQGKLMRITSAQSVHVQWATGTRQGEIDIVDARDLAKVESAAQLARLDPMSTTAVRRCMSSAGPEAVLTFLSSSGRLQSWPDLAETLLAEAKRMLYADDSMADVWEQLDRDEVDRVVHTAAVVLIRDAFTQDDELEVGR